MHAHGYAAPDARSPLMPFTFERRAPRANDVVMEILYCGVCHTDLHFARNDWGNSVYPVVPGHEIVGRVVAVGDAVTKFREGDLAAVGCMVDSCLKCPPCLAGEEQACREGMTQTYNGIDRNSGENTYGGYANIIVVREEFVLRVPAGLDPARVGPLLCAGITTWSPLRHWKVGPEMRVGVIGLGGLGHMAVKLAAGLGAQVTVISTSASKRDDALRLGAHAVLISTDEDAMAAAANSLDVIIDTVPVEHALAPYLPLLDVNGVHVIVGALGPLPPINGSALAWGRRSVAGSLIGGIAETQELLDFCGAHNILPDCEMIAIQDINTAFERMERGQVKYRFVIDMASLTAEDAAA